MYKEPVTLDEIIVTSERTGDHFQTGDVDTEQTPAFFSVIERDQFEGRMEDLAEAIGKEAGVQVRQSGGLGSFSTVSLRGSSSDQVMVFMDGMLLNDASGGGVDLSNIVLSDVESIEIYRGITAMNFNKASIGGVINIKTVRAKDEMILNASAGYGSFNTKRYSGFINHKPGKWDYLISGDYLSAENDFEVVNDNGTVWNPDDDRVERRNNARVEQENLLAKAGFDLTDNMRIDFVEQWFSKDQGLPSWNNSADAKTSLQTRRNINTLKFTANNIGGYGLNTAARISYTDKEEEYDDSQGSVGLGQQRSIYDTARFGLDLFLEWLSSVHSVNLILDAEREEYGVKDLLNRKNPNDSKRESLTAGIQDSMVIFQDRLIVTSGLRYSRINDDLKSAVNSFGEILEGRTERNDYLSPQIGIKIKPNSRLTLKANIARYFREPSFFELFGDRGFFTGNDELRPEQGVNGDAGLEANLPFSGRLFNRISITGSYFVSNVDDLITRAYDARGVGRAVNISSSSINGIESGINLDFLKYFRFSANATWQDTENRSEMGAFNGKDLPGIFESSFLIRVEGNYKGLKAYCENAKESGMYYDTANLIEAEDKVESNAGIIWSIGGLLLSLEGENLGDNLYEDFNGYPLPGRSYSFTIKYGL
ncbi:MAG: TonB-dependent receptor [Deltaproteobacteria bacterium]|nr:TonB-dependent receptor [Deltaproteobacteria bacterium]